MMTSLFKSSICINLVHRSQVWPGPPVILGPLDREVEWDHFPALRISSLIREKSKRLIAIPNDSCYVREHSLGHLCAVRESDPKETR